MSVQGTLPRPKTRRQRVFVERVSPQIDGGQYPVKRVVGDQLRMEADLIADGDGTVAGVLQVRPPGETASFEVPLEPLGNDRWTAAVALTEVGLWRMTFEAWHDPFGTWRRGLEQKAVIGEVDEIDLRIGSELVEAAAGRARGSERDLLDQAARELVDGARPLADRAAEALDGVLEQTMHRYPDRTRSTRYRPVLGVVVDPPLARFGAWYEMFPRSTGPTGEHGTFRDAEEVLPYVASMGFDILYLPPIHPIGLTCRKGPNNALTAGEGDPGSPWAIGGPEGGHKSVHPDLGTLDDFRHFVAQAEAHGLEVALDIAFQTSPDHPYVEAHPSWFRHRPDGTIQYAENPPKKYQDVYPLDFETGDWRPLYKELLSVFLFWVDLGVRIFRVDNPHTKSLAFWAWCIAELKSRHPDVILLSEAFTRPKLMYLLAKLGFTQSYTYFTWRHTRDDFTEYLTELTKTEVREYFRPNFWPNTPDILPPHLTHGGRPAFVSRLVLASTLSSNYGIYGPAFELMERVPRPGAEEYIDNEKYQIRDWNRDAHHSLRSLIARINAIRRASPALHRTDNVHFHASDNEQFLCYSKATEGFENCILVVVNLDPNHTQVGFTGLDLEAMGLRDDEAFVVHDLLTDARYPWFGTRNYVELSPHDLPAHIFRVERSAS